MEDTITELLTHKDPTVLQLCAPKLMLEKWDTDNWMRVLGKITPPASVKLWARTKCLCSVTLLLLDIAPTWGIWDRTEKKAKLKKMLELLSQHQQSMEEDEWQNPHAPRLGEEGEDGNYYTEVFLACGWRTQWPLCDFLREIELLKHHKIQ